MLEDLEDILVNEDSIKRRIAEMGKQLDNTYRGEDLVLMSIVNGGVIFTADLMRAISLPVQLDCLHISNYKDGAHSFSEDEISGQVHLSLKDRVVILIDDILDTGFTLQKIVTALEGLGAKEIKTCVLLRKKGRQTSPFLADFVGFDIPDECVVGYGIDYAEKYRNLPFIGVLKPDCQNPPTWV
ncbi:MAG: hypoxanthine phosphoribosyltransferase [Verrucomicrobiota bacterium]